MNDPKALQSQLYLHPERLLIKTSLKDEYTRKVFTIAITEEEEDFIRSFKGYLHVEGYIPDSSYQNLFNYILTLAFNTHKAIVDPEDENIKRFYSDLFTKKLQDEIK